VDTTNLACVTRVRAMALAAMARAGGRPTRAQLLRVLEPIAPGLIDALTDQPPWAGVDLLTDRGGGRPGSRGPGRCSQAQASRASDRGDAVELRDAPTTR